jgi:hypothetical protein
MRKISSSAEFERAATPVTLSNQTASRSSRIAVNSPQSVKSNSRSLAKSGGEGNLVARQLHAPRIQLLILIL